MSHPLSSRYPLVFWAAVALAAAAGAALLGPWVIPPLDARQEQFRDHLEAGLRLVRLALAAAAALALASALLWRRGDAVMQDDPTPEVSRSSAALGAVALLALTAALALPRLGSALWWDELTTMSTVRRGLAVIFTYSADANNHPLSSLLVWLSLRVLPENEITIHLFSFLCLLATVQVVYWAVLRAAGPRAALIAGLAAAAHPSLVTHGVEARGYAGAVLCASVAVVAFAALLARGSRGLTAVYVAGGVAAFGFISTTILVPAAHGAVACALFLASYRWPGLERYRTNAVNLIFACLWVLVLSLLLFGMPLPQTLAYARGGATRDHLPLGLRLGEQVLGYVSGVQLPALAAALLAVAALGWWAAAAGGAAPRRLRLLLLAALAPLATALLYVLLPGSHTSARFFCFLILPACCGVGLGVDWLLKARPVGRVAFGSLAAGALLAGWLGALAARHQQLLTVNRPDLATLARDLRGSRVALLGPQADVNVYYFPRASSCPARSRSDDDLRRVVGGAEVVVEGRTHRDNRLDTPDERLVALGFRIERVLANAVDRTEYLVYRRSTGGAGGEEASGD